MDCPIHVWTRYMYDAYACHWRWHTWRPATIFFFHKVLVIVINNQRRKGSLGNYAHQRKFFQMKILVIVFLCAKYHTTRIFRWHIKNALTRMIANKIGQDGRWLDKTRVFTRQLQSLFASVLKADVTWVTERRVARTQQTHVHRSSTGVGSATWRAREYDVIVAGL